MKSSFFVDRPILSIAVAAVILLLGFLGYRALPVEQFPDIAPPVVEVTADYAGASADAVQKSVIIPLEEAINSVDGIDEILSSSNSSGNASISITFKPGTDPDMAAVLVKNRIGEVEGILPQEVIETGVRVEKEQRSYLRMIALESPDGRYDNDFVSNFFDINVKPKLQRINGVSRVEMLGSVYAMRIWLDPKRMAHFGLEPKDIEAVLEAQNIEAAIGTLGEDSKNTFQYTMVYRGRLVNAEEFGNIVLRSDEGNDLRLRDVARCEIGRESYASDSWVNGRPGVVALLMQAAGSNAQQVNNEIDRLLEESQGNMPPGLEFRTLLNTNDFLTASMNEVYKTLFEAILLVVLVVLLFLQNVRATLIPAFAIIVSLVGTFAFLFVAGFTLNLITLFALVLVIGTVVDDAIVVVEAVQSQFDAGEHRPYEATQKAMHNIGRAVVSTTIVFMAVFIPIAFVNGLVGTYYRQFGLTMAVAVIISTLNALTLSPALCVLMLKPGNGTARFYRAFNAVYAAVASKYKEALAGFFSRKWLIVAGAAVVIVLLGYLVRIIPTSLIPDEDTGNVFVDITTPPGSTLEQTKKAVEQAASKVATIDEIENCASVAGWNILGGEGANTGMLIMKLKHWDERPGDDHEIDAVLTQIDSRMDSIKTASMFTYALPTVTGYGFSNNIELYVQDYNSLSVEKLKQVTDNFVEALEERDEIGEAYCSYEVNYPQYTVSVNAAICKRYGIEPSAVLGVLNGYIGSSYTTQFNAFGRMYEVVMQADPELRNSPDDLNNIFVVTDESKHIPITEMVSLKKSYGVQSLNRFNLYAAVNVEVEPEWGFSTGDAMKAIEQVAKTVLPRGYGFEYTGMAQEEIKTNANRNWILLLAILFIYIVLAALYESMLIPLAVLLSIPFGLLGSYLFALLFQIENNIYMQVGVIMLIGLLAKTAILLTEYASERRREGMSIREAAISAAKERLRPILMTVMTLVIGLMPMVFATGALAVGSMSLGLCVIGGMLMGTLSILFFVPVFFMLFQHLDEKYMPRRRKGTAATAVVVLAVLSPLFTSCKTYSNYQAQTVDTDSLLRSEFARAITTDTLQGWRQMFSEPLLASLIEEGLAHNSNLRIARLNVEAALAEKRSATLALLPSLDVKGEASGTQGQPEDDDEPDREWNLGLAPSWELDIFGKMQNERKAAMATVEEKQAYVQALQVELIATIATGYYQLEMYDSQIDDTRAILESWDESIRAQKALLAVGAATIDEVEQAEASRLEAEAKLAELTNERMLAENELCTVLGRPSGHIERGHCSVLNAQSSVLSAPSSLPLHALASRPDVRQAEAALMSAFYLTNAARAAFYPSITISAFIGRNGARIGDDYLEWSQGKLLAELAAPIFARGRLKADLRKAKAEQEAALITFRQTLLDAGREVNDALSRQQYAQNTIRLSEQQVEKLSHVVETAMTRMRYDAEVNYLQVLIARQSLLEARLALHNLRFELVEASIQLYKALGGGKGSAKPTE